MRADVHCQELRLPPPLLVDLGLLSRGLAAVSIALLIRKSSCKLGARPNFRPKGSTDEVVLTRIEESPSPASETVESPEARVK